MSIYKTKLSVGDTAYRVSLSQKRYTKTCPLCAGNGRVKIAASDRTVSCPECHWGKVTVSDPLSHVVGIDVVGQVAIEDRAGNVKITYMLESTGVGSGSVWSDADVFAVQSDALAEALRRDSELNK